MHEFIRIRKRHGISRALAAVICGVSYGAVRTWETGARKPKGNPTTKLNEFIEWRETLKSRSVNGSDDDYVRAFLSIESPVCDDCGKDTAEQNIHNCPARDVNKSL